MAGGQPALADDELPFWVSRVREFTHTTDRSGTRTGQAVTGPALCSSVPAVIRRFPNVTNGLPAGLVWLTAVAATACPAATLRQAGALLTKRPPRRR